MLKAFDVPDDVSKKAWRVIQLQTDKAISALKEAGRYGDDGRGQKRDGDGWPKTSGGSFFAALNAKAKQSIDLPVGALPPAVGPGLEPALDFDGVRLGNAVDVASELTKYLQRPRAELGPEHPNALQLWWDIRKDCPALAIVAIHYLCIPASSAGVERLFSGTGLIKSTLRNRLLARTLEKLVFTRRNWNDSLYLVRPKKPQGVEESKGGDRGAGEQEEEEESEEEREKLWAELEEEMAGDLNAPIVRDDDELGLDGLMGLGFEEPGDAFWAGFEDMERWMDEE